MRCWFLRGLRPLSVTLFFIVLTTGLSQVAASDVGAPTRELAPFFYLDLDWGQSIVNLTPHKWTGPGSSWGLDDFQSGFQKISFHNLTTGLGAHLSFWYPEAAGLSREWWTYVGLIPLIGKESRSVKFHRGLSEARATRGYRAVPTVARSLDSWSTGDSLTYRSRGGLLFAAGAGLGAIGVGSTALAQGSWEIAIEKITRDKVYVKITREQIHSLSFSVGAALVQAAVTDFRESDKGFSFLFDLRSETGCKGYEDMIRGNVLAAETLALREIAVPLEQAGTAKIVSFQTLGGGRLFSSQQGFPGIWFRQRTRGQISSFSSAEFPLKNKNAQVHYGVYSQSKRLLFLSKHRETEQVFYGVHYAVKSPKETHQGRFGQFHFLHTNDATSARKFEKVLRELIKLTGIEEFAKDSPARALGYVGIDFETTFNQENTQRLMIAAQTRDADYFVGIGDRYLKAYRQRGDPFNHCLGPVLPGCRRHLQEESFAALQTMHHALRTMALAQDRDPVAFTEAYAKFGEAFGKNHITFRSALELAGPGVELRYLLEGTRLSLYFKSWKTTETPNRWATVYNPDEKGPQAPLPFEPRLRHTRLRGLILKPGVGGLEIFKTRRALPLVSAAL